MSGPLQTLALFPLSNVVLFPGLGVPLHIFEPRYRQMLEDVLAGDERIGMATVRPEHGAEMDGDPPLFEVGCAGIVASSERLPDGRLNIVLLATQRFRIVSEAARPPERLYRVAQVELLDEIDPPWLAARAAELRACVNQRFVALAARRGAGAAVLPSIFDSLDDAAFANGVSQLLELPAPEKQGLLEAAGPAERLERLDALLRFRLAELEAPAEAAGRPLH
jgi:hypothetical protein